jgi:Rad3-related DNA helicase
LASFDEHILQAKSNLKFLEETNSKCQSFWDWQVTTSFYIAVHIVNAHLAKIGNLHYRTHEDVKNAINPHRPMAIGKVDEAIYLCYVKLEGLSRRSRYLCHGSAENHETNGHLTFDKHFSKAIRKLDILLTHFNDRYDLALPATTVKSPELSSGEDLNFFSV